MSICLGIFLKFRVIKLEFVIWKNIDTKSKTKIKKNFEKFFGILYAILLKDCNDIGLKDIICFEVFLKFLIFYYFFILINRTDLK